MFFFAWKKFFHEHQQNKIDLKVFFLLFYVNFFAAAFLVPFVDERLVIIEAGIFIYGKNIFKIQQEAVFGGKIKFHGCF